LFSSIPLKAVEDARLNDRVQGIIQVGKKIKEALMIMALAIHLIVFGYI
jgi:hypothetical protein